MSIAQIETTYNLEPLPVDIYSPGGQIVKTIVDGYYENEAIGEWEVIVDGEQIGYAQDEPTARQRYNEALRIRREHTAKQFYSN
jgi:hypothetical protein